MNSEPISLTSNPSLAIINGKKNKATILKYFFYSVKSDLNWYSFTVPKL